MQRRAIPRALSALTIAAAATALVSCGGDGDDRVKIGSVTVFGDSLSDVGTYGVATGNAANPGRFTVNPGQVWTQNVAAHYRLEVTPYRSLTMDRQASSGATDEDGTATVVGGNGYAEGGARVAKRPSVSGVGNNQLVAPVREQVEQYLASHDRFPKDSLVLVSGGANDIYAQFSTLCWDTDENNLGPGNTTHDIAAANIAETAQSVVAMIEQIRASGARVIVLLLQSEPTASPFWRHYGEPQYQATGCSTAVPPAERVGWARAFNDIVRDGLVNLPEVILVDAATVWADVLAQPSRYGLVNTTDAGCTNTEPTSSAVFCTEDTLVAADAARTYLWSDDFHPSPRGHEILSDHALTLLQHVAR